MERKFVCSFCQTEHPSAPDRARCELACEKRLVEEVEREQQEKLRKERNTRAEEVRKAKENYLRLEAAFREDYKTDIWWSKDDFAKEFPTLFFGGWPL